MGSARKEGLGKGRVSNRKKEGQKKKTDWKRIYRAREKGKEAQKENTYRRGDVMKMEWEKKGKGWGLREREGKESRHTRGSDTALGARSE